jgi:sulfatase modifying factor 1
MAVSGAPGPAATQAPAPFPGMTWIPGGSFLMGSNSFYPEERPVHLVEVDGFWIDWSPAASPQP